MVSTPEKQAAPVTPTAVAPPPRASQDPLGYASVWLTLRLPAEWSLTDDLFIELSELNPLWKIETTEEGELLIMTGEGKTTSEIGVEIATDLSIWNRGERRGAVRGASGAVKHSERHIMIPDVSWISNEREGAAIAEADTILIPTCPEFVVEIRSSGQSLPRQQEKMEQWIRHGALLGWLVDPVTETVWVYRPDAEPELMERPAELGGEDICEGLVVSFARVWTSREAGGEPTDQ